MNNYLDGATYVDELIFQAIGAATRMWDHPERAGVFRVYEAKILGLELKERLDKAYGEA